MASDSPRLVLTEIPEGCRVVAPAGLSVGDTLPLPATVKGMWVTLGSGERQDIILRDDPLGVRRSHVRFGYRNGAYVVQSRGHPTGYVLNGTHHTDCTARPLQEGDELQLGPHLKFRYTEAAGNLRVVDG